MDENMISPTELNRIAFLKKKRKFQAELLGLPLPKHVCWAQTHNDDSSSDSSNEPKKVRSIILAKGAESDQESDNYSFSFHGNSDSLTSSSQFSKESHSSVDPSTSSPVIDLYSLESRSVTKSSFSKSESEEVDFLHNNYEMYASDDYDDHLQQLGNHEDCIWSEQCTDDKDLDDNLYSNGVAPSNYVLSSGRWSVNQDAQQGSQKLTIDKEFEQYFSMLML